MVFTANNVDINKYKLLELLNIFKNSSLVLLVSKYVKQKVFIISKIKLASFGK